MKLQDAQRTWSEAAEGGPLHLKLERATVTLP